MEDDGDTYRNGSRTGSYSTSTAVGSADDDATLSPVAHSPRSPPPPAAFSSLPHYSSSSSTSSSSKSESECESESESECDNESECMSNNTNDHNWSHLNNDDNNIPGQPPPFHDEHADSDDEQWMIQHLVGQNLHLDDKQHQKQQHQKQQQQQRLSCPRCFSTLTLQSQAHTAYVGQFRAFLVRNCHVNHDSRCTASVSIPTGSRKEWEKHDCGSRIVTSSKTLLRDVACDACDTRVGVYETSTGAYHFCNVIW